MENRNIACFTRYGYQGASSRLRTFQYEQALRALGYDLAINSLLSSKYVDGLNHGQRRWAEVIKGYATRVAARRIAQKSDLIFIEKELFPWFPLLAEKLMMPSNTPIVLDFDDAIFHNYDLNQFPGVRQLLGRKIDRLMRRADVVTAGNEYLMARAHQAGARRVEYLPTVVDIDHYPLHPKADAADLVVGWIGSPTTAQYLRLIEAALEQLCAKFNARVVLVGAGSSTDSYRFPVTILPWSEATEGAIISQFDVGIMPLIDGPWERGKCGYKLIQYMACAKPVVASAVGANLSVVQHGVQGFHATESADWIRYMGELLSSASLRREMGAAGRERVTREYSLQRGTTTLARIFNSL